MRRAWGVGMFPARVYVGQIIAVFAIVLAAVWGATQWTAAALGYQAALGVAWFKIAGFPVYLPWRLFEWWYAYDAYAPHDANRTIKSEKRPSGNHFLVRGLAAWSHMSKRAPLVAPPLTMTNKLIQRFNCA